MNDEKFLVSAVTDFGILPLIIDTLDDYNEQQATVSAWTELLKKLPINDDHIDEPIPTEYESIQNWFAEDFYQLFQRINIIDNDGGFDSYILKEDKSEFYDFVRYNYYINRMDMVDMLLKIIRYISESSRTEAEVCKGLFVPEFIYISLIIGSEDYQTHSQIANQLLAIRKKYIGDNPQVYDIIEIRSILSDSFSLELSKELDSIDISQYIQPTQCTIMLLAYCQIIYIDGLMEPTQFITI